MLFIDPVAAGAIVYVLDPVGLKLILPVAVKLVNVAVVGIALPIMTLLIVPGAEDGAIETDPVSDVGPLTLSAVSVPKLVRLLFTIPLPSVVAVKTVLFDPSAIVPAVRLKFPLICRLPLESTVNPGLKKPEPDCSGLTVKGLTKFAMFQNSSCCIYILSLVIICQ
jgi:hypothetical protein